MNPLLSLENVSVSFDGFKAINDLNISINRGELRCIIGPNGAGKSTMMDIITGKTQPDEGRVFFKHKNLLGKEEHQIARLGIGRKFQKPSVFEALTVVQNLELSGSDTQSVAGLLLAKLSRHDLHQIESILCTIGLQEQRDQQAGALSHGQKQWLEIGMLLMMDPELLLVDEPVAGMTHQEMDRTAELLNTLAGKHTLMVVEHDMGFIRSIARTVTVLNQGSVLYEGAMDKVQSNPEVIQVYLGDGA
jgi:urea transport system ATP-binding protein